MRDSFLKLKLGADGAQADDTNRLKTSVANWLNNAQDHPECLLKPEDKLSRGFHNTVTSWLLCPVDYDWLDVSYVSMIYRLVNDSN